MVGEMTLSVCRTSSRQLGQEGLAWLAYSNDELFALEQDLIFRAH